MDVGRMLVCSWQLPTYPDFKNNGEEVAYMKLVDVYQVVFILRKLISFN